MSGGYCGFKACHFAKRCFAIPVLQAKRIVAEGLYFPAMLRFFISRDDAHWGWGHQRWLPSWMHTLRIVPPHVRFCAKLETYPIIIIM